MGVVYAAKYKVGTSPEDSSENDVCVFVSKDKTMVTNWVKRFNRIVLANINRIKKYDGDILPYKFYDIHDKPRAYIQEIELR